jgi:hypothetical protein
MAGFVTKLWYYSMPMVVLIGIFNTPANNVENCGENWTSDTRICLARMTIQGFDHLGAYSEQQTLLVAKLSIKIT